MRGEERGGGEVEMSRPKEELMLHPAHKYRLHSNSPHPNYKQMGHKHSKMLS